MYVGASMLHSGDTFRMFDPVSKRIHLTRDVKMLRKLFYRQDDTISSDQPHPLDTTFENLTIIQGDEVTGEVSTDEVRVNDAFRQTNVDTDSLASFSSDDDDSVDSCKDMPALERPPPDSSYSSESDNMSLKWTMGVMTMLFWMPMFLMPQIFSLVKYLTPLRPSQQKFQIQVKIFRQLVVPVVGEE